MRLLSITLLVAVLALIGMNIWAFRELSVREPKEKVTNLITIENLYTDKEGLGKLK